MKQTLLTLILVLTMTAGVFAQHPRTHAQYPQRLYEPYYNGWGLVPGLTLYNNGYSYDTFAGSRRYRYSYTPPGYYGNGPYYSYPYGMTLPNGYYYNPYGW